MQCVHVKKGMMTPSCLLFFNKEKFQNAIPVEPAHNRPDSCKRKDSQMNRPRAKAAISLILAASLVMPQSVWAVIARAGSESTETLVDSTSSDASGQPDTIE